MLGTTSRFTVVLKELMNVWLPNSKNFLDIQTSSCKTVHNLPDMFYTNLSDMLRQDNVAVSMTVALHLTAFMDINIANLDVQRCNNCIHELKGPIVKVGKEKTKEGTLLSNIKEEM